MVDLDQLGSDDKRSVRDVAEAFLAWAKQKNLFDKTPLEDGLDQDEVDYDVTSNEFLAQATETILRKRSVNLVGFSEPERKIIVFTHSKVSKSDEKTLPFKFGECTVEYAQGGIAQVKGNPPPPQNPQPYILRGNHYTCGSSVFPAHCIGAGTLGLIVKDNQGKLYGLSNNHVTGACNNAMPGLPILAPGPLDATENACDPFTVGRHSSLLPINDGIPENIDISENCDASLFELSDSSKVTSYQGNYFDTPQTTAIPIPSMKVKKVVRTTGLTLGTIVAQSASPVPVSYAVTEYGVKKNCMV
ncbi:hypothetical protein [Ruegeria arenilitoris]|uniref:hypothetical protein n=1 Tax=Ruegeria arenilitoris TaxID=1173585 RepID=UPI00147F2D00|nr:hypothetical protein [Ruegeria arenilitoris]